MTSERRLKYRSLLFSLALSALILAVGIYTIDDLSIQKLFSRLLRLMIFISIGLVAGQIIEATGWARVLGAPAGPIFKFGNLGQRCSAAFTTAFISGAAANSMLLGFYKEAKIDRRQLFLANFINQFPAFFLHLPTTLFIIIPLTGWAGVLYILITFSATLLRTALFLVYGHVSPGPREADKTGAPPLSFVPVQEKKKAIWRGIRDKFPGRITGIAVYVVPIYIVVFILNGMGIFSLTRSWLAKYVVTTVMPVEALSLVILSFAAEFTSGFAAAGALLDAGILSTKQTVLALLMGNVIAFPVRAVRHQLPRYMGIFSPKMGTQLLLMGQGFRVLSLVIVGYLYYCLG